MSHQKQEVSRTVSVPKSEAKETSGKLVPSLHRDSREGSLTDSQLCQLVENDPQTLKLLDFCNKLAKTQPLQNELDRTEAQFSDSVSGAKLIAACEEASRAQRSVHAIPQHDHWDSSLTDSQLNSAYDQALHIGAPSPAPAKAYFPSLSDSQILLACDQVFLESKTKWTRAFPNPNSQPLASWPSANSSQPSVFFLQMARPLPRQISCQVAMSFCPKVC